MSTCVTCGSYFKLSKFHKDERNCMDCIDQLYTDDLDLELELDIQQILHPSGKTASIRYDEDCDN